MPKQGSPGNLGRRFQELQTESITLAHYFLIAMVAINKRRTIHYLTGMSSEGKKGLYVLIQIPGYVNFSSRTLKQQTGYKYT